MLYMSLSSFKSCYEEEVQRFNTLDEEFLYFIQNYRIDPNLPLDCLVENKKVSYNSGKKEIAGIWESLYDLVNSRISNEKNITKDINE